MAAGTCRPLAAASHCVTAARPMRFETDDPNSQTQIASHSTHETSGLVTRGWVFVAVFGSCEEVQLEYSILMLDARVEVEGDLQ